MTQINMNFKRPLPDGTNYAARGSLKWEPTARRDMEGYILLPQAFTVDLVNGQASVIVLPTTADWYWKVTENFQHIRQVQEYVYVVPDSVSAIDYDDLIAINPITFQGYTPPDAWAVALNAETASRQSEDNNLQQQIDAIEASDIESINGETGTVVVSLIENPPNSFFYEIQVSGT